MARISMAAVALAVVIGGFAAARAQTQAGAGSPDVLPALLTEVRGLRVAMEQMAMAGARVQLTLGRLQLQEQRLGNAIKRLDETRNKLTEAQRAVTEMQEQLASLEAVREGAAVGALSVMVNHTSGQASAEEAERQKQEMQKMFTRQTAHFNAEIQRLTGEEAALAAEVAGEQARWMEFNQKLEDLERSLARK